MRCRQRGGEELTNDRRCAVAKGMNARKNEKKKPQKTMKEKKAARNEKKGR
jgi:hypothetical protein